MTDDIVKVKTLPDGTYILIKGDLIEIVRLRPGESREVFGIQFNSPNDTGMELPSDSER